jgi:hypothetical protein
MVPVADLLLLVADMSLFDPPSSLAPYRESVPDEWRPALDPEGRFSRCPKKLGWVLVNDATGVKIPARCKANSCPYCGPINAHLVAGAIGIAAPQRAIRYSLVGDSWQERRNKLKKLRFLLRQAGYKTHEAYHVEPNPNGTGHHAHAWQYGDYLPQGKLQELSQQAGMGIPYIEAMKKAKGPVDYGLKGIDYGLKGIDADNGLQTYLVANGGRLVHASRGFWRDQNGNPLAGVREAMANYARTKGNDEREGTWLLMREEATA